MWWKIDKDRIWVLLLQHIMCVTPEVFSENVTTTLGVQIRSSRALNGKRQDITFLMMSIQNLERLCLSSLHWFHWCVLLGLAGTFSFQAFELGSMTSGFILPHVVLLSPLSHFREFSVLIWPQILIFFQEFKSLEAQLLLWPFYNDNNKKCNMSEYVNICH